MLGFSVSLTVTLKVHALVLPLASLAVQVTGVVPFANVLPLAAVKVTVAGQRPPAVVARILAGQVIVGFSVSLTVTVNVHALVLPTASVAVQVTVVIPLLKAELLAGLHTTPTPGQLSVALG